MAILLSELQDLLDTLTATYTVEICNDGTMRALNSSSVVVYRGSQVEVIDWLSRQPTS